MIVSAINTFTPKKKSRDLNKPPWINGKLLKAIRKKKTLWQSLKRDPNNAGTRENSRKTSCHPARRNYFTKIASEVHSPTILVILFFKE